MQGAATQAMRGHRRGAATPQMPVRSRNPKGAWGLHGDRRVARRQRCPRIASSSRLALAAQAPCARPLLLLGQAPRQRQTIKLRAPKESAGCPDGSIGGTMIRSILIALAEAPYDASAKNYAFWLARKEGSHVHALAVIDIAAFEVPVMGAPDGFMPSVVTPPLRESQSLMNDLAAAAKEHLDRFASQCVSRGIPSST